MIPRLHICVDSTFREASFPGFSAVSSKGATMDATQARAKLWAMIKDIKFAMLVTEQEDGTLRSRPMATQQAEFEGELWFFTAMDAPKVAEVRHHAKVNLSYAEPEDQKYVSVSGTCEV